MSQEPQIVDNEARAGVDFWSVDSAPRRFAGKVSQARAPILLGLFALISFGLLWLVNSTPKMNSIFYHNDFILAPAYGGHSVAMRTFMIAFLSAFSLTCGGSIRKRLGVLADMLLSYIVVCLLIDAVGFLMHWKLHVLLSLHIYEIASGMLGFAIFAFKLLERGEMPARIPLEIDSSTTRQVVLRFLLVASFAAGLAYFINLQDLEIIKSARSWSLLGGIGPGVFLFLPIFFTVLYLWARLDGWLSPKRPFSPPLTVFVPAHNEEYIIEKTILAMDSAANEYDGEIRLLIMNNNSADDTARVAKEVLAKCTGLLGEVIDVPQPGKANALNAGLDAVETEFCVRIDADTQPLPNAFKSAMQHFEDPKVAVVGGVPLPLGGGLFDRARYLEVAVKHAFYSVSFGAVNCVVGIPGMLSVYRTELPRKLGGFVEGMNGEDTDISLRAGELGYRLVVDPKVQYYSEVPATYGHMREQRMRWFRSSFHIAARCRDLMYSRTISVRGKLMLPYMLINSGRRAMMVPLLIFGLIEYFTSFASFNILTWQAILAVTIGAPAIVAVACALLMGSFKGILYVPEYLLFRVLRGYFTLESMLSITIKSYGEHIYSKKALARKRPSSVRVA